MFNRSDLSFLHSFSFKGKISFSLDSSSQADSTIKLDFNKIKFANKPTNCSDTEKEKNCAHATLIVPTIWKNVEIEPSIRYLYQLTTTPKNKE